MRVYVGQTRAPAWQATVRGYGWGECCCPSELPPRILPWFLDNEAWRRWQAGKAFDPGWWRESVAQAREVPTAPDFVVSPDIVRGGLASLRLSCEWAGELRATGWPVYLVVQNGMRLADVLAVVQDFDGLFVGGDTQWKWETARAWCELGRELAMPVHIGRAGSFKRAVQARDVGASSWDSSMMLRASRNMRRFVAGLAYNLAARPMFGQLGKVWREPGQAEQHRTPPRIGVPEKRRPSNVAQGVLALGLPWRES